MSAPLLFRWLGVAGIELKLEEQVLAVDPFFTRPPLWRMWFGRTSSNHALAFEKVPFCSYILVTHSHYDHLMDVPALAEATGAQVYGSRNTCKVCTAAGIPPEQVHEVTVGDRLTLGAFTVEVHLARHIRLPVDRLVNGPLPKNLRMPMRLRDYRMDVCFSFRIEVHGCTLLIGDCPLPADVLFYIPLRPKNELLALLPIVKPRLLVPIHWDDFFRPLSRPLRPSWALPGRNPFRLRRLNLDAFRQEVEGFSPGTTVLVPEVFHVYDLGQLISN